MPAYLVKDILQPLSHRAVQPKRRAPVLIETDRDDPDPVTGDELYGAPDEADPPEDPAQEIPIGSPALLYCNRNPRGRPCPECQRLLGTVWQAGHQPRLPRHEGCFCYYQRTWQPPDKTRKRFRHAPHNQAHPEEKLI